MIDVSEYIGIPFVSGGRARTGCDCWGLLRIIYADLLGVEVPVYGDYVRPVGAEASRLIIEGRDAWTLIANREDWEKGRRAPVPLDAVLFNVNGRPNHIGVVVAPTWMLHSTAGTGSCLEQYTRPLWRSRIEGFYRVR